MNATLATPIDHPAHSASGYTVGEEIANAVTHGIGALLGIAALVILVVSSAGIGDPWRIVSFSIYGATLIALYLTSTLYHAVTSPRVKALLRRCDHAAIFLLIGGSYTPLLLVSLRGPLGWVMAGIIWGMMVSGVVMKLWLFPRLSRVLLGLNLAMGWAAVVIVHALWREFSIEALAWLFGGGAAYSVGVVFYVQKRLRFAHAIWHLFVLAGSACHFVFFYRHVLPS